MTDTNNTKYEDITDDTDELFNGGDFVFTQTTDKNGETKIVGGGFNINSFFLQEGTSPMRTYNTSDQMGGKVSSSFENLAVPAGLFYVNMRVPKQHHEKKTKNYEKHTPISDDLIDKLFSLVDVDKKRKRKTKRHSMKLEKNKTRKHKHKHK